MAALMLRPLPIPCQSLLPTSWNQMALKPAHSRLPPPGKRSASALLVSAATEATAAVNDANGSGNEGGEQTTDDAKASLYRALEGINRGIFGATSSKKTEIAALVKLLESQNSIPNPTDYLGDKVGGCWKLVYSTISILGGTRTKLGLRDFISLGDFLQIIDVAKEKATNVVKFNFRGLKVLKGKLTIEASYRIVSKTRVDIKLESSSITPDQLMKIFEKNLDILLGIFNPEGWLEITYVDDSMRIGRDDKGNIFVLERSEGIQV